MSATKMKRPLVRMAGTFMVTAGIIELAVRFGRVWAWAFVVAYGLVVAIMVATLEPEDLV